MAIKAGKRNKPTYDDQFRSSAVLMLKSQGYPEIEGALSIVAKHLKVPASTLSRWFKGTSNPPPSNIVNEKRAEFRTVFTDEIYAIMGVLPNKRDEASYGSLVTAAGIFFDKLRLLDGLPTEIVSVTVELAALAKQKGIDPATALRTLRDRMAALPDAEMITAGSGVN